MQESIRIEAKTMEAAIEEAAARLSCTVDEVSYEVIEKGTTGFLGFKSKPFVIEATKKESDIVTATETVTPVVAEEPAEVVSEEAPKTAVNGDELVEAAKAFLSSVFASMKLEVAIEASYNQEEGCVEVNMSGDEMGNLIGKRGQTLDSLQYLTSLVVNKKTSEYTRVKLDTENYRERRKETLENLANNIAFKVKRTKRSVKLEPMNPYERRIIHSALQNDRYVTTKSEGEEPYRHVVVLLKKERRY